MNAMKSEIIFWSTHLTYLFVQTKDRKIKLQNINFKDGSTRVDRFMKIINETRINWDIHESLDEKFWGFRHREIKTDARYTLAGKRQNKHVQALQCRLLQGSV